MIEMINKNAAKSEISMIFVQLTSRLMEVLMGFLLVLFLKECLVECATEGVKSVVILSYVQVLLRLRRTKSKIDDK
jgi:hypothetical protein